MPSNDLRTSSAKAHGLALAAAAAAGILMIVLLLCALLSWLLQQAGVQ